MQIGISPRAGKLGWKDSRFSTYQALVVRSLSGLILSGGLHGTVIGHGARDEALNIL